MIIIETKTIFQQHEYVKKYFTHIKFNCYNVIFIDLRNVQPNNVAGVINRVINKTILYLSWWTGRNSLAVQLWKKFFHLRKSPIQDTGIYRVLVLRIQLENLSHFTTQINKNLISNGVFFFLLIGYRKKHYLFGFFFVYPLVFELMDLKSIRPILTLKT